MGKVLRLPDRARTELRASLRLLECLVETRQGRGAQARGKDRWQGVQWPKVQRSPSSWGILRLSLQSGEQGLSLSLRVAHDQASCGPRWVTWGQVERKKAQQVGEVHISSAESLGEVGGALGEQCFI
jgi:hypothetical protein